MLINIGKRIPEMKEDVPNNFGFVKFIEKYNKETE